MNEKRTTQNTKSVAVPISSPLPLLFQRDDLFEIMSSMRGTDRLSKIRKLAKANSVINYDDYLTFVDKSIFLDNDCSCSICVDCLKHEESSSKLSCNHIFHTECIKTWLNYKLICPNCNSKLKINKTDIPKINYKASNKFNCDDALKQLNTIDNDVLDFLGMTNSSKQKPIDFIMSPIIAPHQIIDASQNEENYDHIKTFEIDD